MPGSLGLQRAERLCRIESPTGDLEGAERILQELCAQAPAGATCQRKGPTSPGAGQDLLITLHGSGRGGALMLGHYDNVPRAPEQPLWDPQGDRVRGLGVYDMKGGLAVMLELLERWSQTPERFAVLHALILGDEEWRLRPPTYRFGHWVNTRGAAWPSMA